MAASEAVTVKIINEKIWPILSSKKIEKIKKLKLIDKNNNSIEIKIIIKFFRVINIPKILKKNNTKENIIKKKDLNNIFYFFNLK